MKAVTDPALLAQLNGDQPTGPKPVTDPAILAQLNGEAPPSIAADVAKTIPSGLARGAASVVGLPGSLRDLVNWASDKIGLGIPEEYNRGMPSQYMLPSPSQIQSGIEKVTGPLYQPQTTPGKYVNSVAELAPGMLVGGPGGMMSKAAQTVGAGVGSEFAGQMTEGTKAEPYARVAGAIVGGAAPGIAQRVVTPLPASTERNRLVDTLNKEGVTSLTAGQKTGNKTLQYAESILGDAPGAGGKTAATQEQGLKQFTEAAMRRAGSGPTATPEVLADNYSRLGNEFSRLSQNNTLQFDPQFANDLSSAVRVYAKVPASQQKAVVQGYLDDIVSNAQQGGMPGTLYQEMRSRLSRQAKAYANSDPTLSSTLGGLRDALDSAMERSISPQDAAAWALARKQYGAQKVLEKAASRAGEATAEGNIVPANLRNIVSSDNRGAYARGSGDFADLARAGASVMAPLPNSGTGQRVAIHTIASLLGGGVGSAGGMGVGSALGAAAGAAAGPALVGRALMSKPVQGYLGNQLLGQPSASLSKNAQLAGLVQALLESSRRHIGH